MIKRLFIALVMTMIAVIFIQLAANYRENTALSPLGTYYADQGPAEVGAANLVTAVVVILLDLVLKNKWWLAALSIAGIVVSAGFALSSRDTPSGATSASQSMKSLPFFMPLVFQMKGMGTFPISSTAFHSALASSISFKANKVTPRSSRADGYVGLAARAG